MTRKEVEELFKKYIQDGFTKIDFELTNDRVIGYTKDKFTYTFNESAIWLIGDGLIISINYSIIKAIVI